MFFSKKNLLWIAMFIVGFESKLKFKRSTSLKIFPLLSISLWFFVIDIGKTWWFSDVWSGLRLGFCGWKNNKFLMIHKFENAVFVKLWDSRGQEQSDLISTSKKILPKSNIRNSEKGISGLKGMYNVVCENRNCWRFYPF